MKPEDKRFFPFGREETFECSEDCALYYTKGEKCSFLHIANQHGIK